MTASIRLSLFQVDAFAEIVFEGNPAAVVPLDEWPEDGRYAHRLGALPDDAVLVPALGSGLAHSAPGIAAWG